MFVTLRKAFAALLERERPVAVISTYPLYGYLLDDITQRGGPSTFLRVMVVTDSISINTIWHRCTTDFFFVPNEDTAAVLRRRASTTARIGGWAIPWTRGSPNPARYRRGRTSTDPTADGCCT